jgi:PAS domain S-box-containing protein
MNKSVRVLHLEDSPRDAELIQRKLEIGGLACEIVRVDSKEGFELALAKDVYDVILCDHNLPDYDGRSALALAREKLPGIPVISLSGTLGEEEAVECLKHGATDYVLKHRLERLVPAVSRALQEAEERRARLQAEEASRASEEQFRAMFEVASIGMAQADPRSGQFLRVNQKMCAITGYSAPELLRMQVPELSHPDDRQKDSEMFQRVMRGEASDYRIEKRYVRKDGAIVWVNVNMTVIRDAAGQPTRTMATIEEITERKQLEEALRESSQFNQQIVASAQEGIIVYGRDLKYQVWNPFMEQLSGLPAREVLGKHPGELFPFLRDTGVLASIEKALAGEPTPTTDFHFKGVPSGKSGWTSDSNGPLRNAAGEIIGVIGIVRDITDRKRAELRIEAFSKLGLRLSAAKTAREAAGIIC